MRKTVKVTFYVLLQALNALERTARAAGETRTDAINRGISLYWAFHQVWRRGDQIGIRWPDGRANEMIVEDDR